MVHICSGVVQGSRFGPLLFLPRCKKKTISIFYYTLMIWQIFF